MDVYADNIQEATIEAVIYRADGTVENLGVISQYRKPWWKRLLQKLPR
jgi:hypothetical protein